MTENKRFVCYFDNIVKKWCVQDTDSLDMHYVADEPMGEEFAHLLNLYHQTLDNVEKENEQLKSDKEHLMGCLIRFFGYDDEDIDYNLNRESNREYGKQYYSMKEETKNELEE